MGSKQKKMPLPASLEVEAIFWDDHSEVTNDRLEMSIPRFMTIGGRLFEDDRQVILCHSLDPDEEYLHNDNQMTYTSILKPCIVRRVVVGTFELGS